MGKFGFSFSLNRLLGITQAKQKFARSTGIPTTKSGMERKIGSSILKMFFKLKKTKTKFCLCLTKQPLI